MKGTIPIATLFIGLASIAATYIPLVGQWLVYDRSAIIDGEIWRLITGHLYHFSPLHLWCNLVPLVLIGTCVERKSGAWFTWVCLMMGMTIGVSLFFAHPFMVRFGGGSGLVCGLFAYFGFAGANARGDRGAVCRITLTVILLKIGYELYTGDPLWVDWDDQGFVVMPLSHVVGFLSAPLCLLVQSVVTSDLKKVFWLNLFTGFAQTLNPKLNFEITDGSDSMNNAGKDSVSWMTLIRHRPINGPIHRSRSVN